MMSWDTTVSTPSPPTSRTSSSLSMSHTSTTTCPLRPSGLSLIAVRLRTTRSARASASSALPSDASTTTALALLTDTLRRLDSMSGHPLRTTTSVPWKSKSASATSASMAAFSLSASTTTFPPPSDAFARHSCFSIGSVLSFHPRKRVWPSSSTSLWPLRSSSIFSPTASDTMPSIKAVTTSPPSAVDRPTTLCSRLASSPTKVQSRPTPASAAQNVEEAEPPVAANRARPDAAAIHSVTAARRTALLYGLLLSHVSSR
mmetsp:Transcript_22463/g.76318  ORF Transcript_22463/g.76318 Transcript_22463/m.76318 type:complete len:259 (+) Transcript_22463:1577-2353(+)